MRTRRVVDYGGKAVDLGEFLVRFWQPKRMFTVDLREKG